MPTFQHPDPDLARDPLSTNRRMLDLSMFGTLVLAGLTPDHINVLIPDTVGPTVDAESPVDLQHVVGLWVPRRFSVHHCLQRIWLWCCVKIRWCQLWDWASILGREQPYSSVDIPVVESLSPLIISSTAPLPVVDAPVRSLTPNNRSFSYMQSGSTDQPQLHVPLSRGQFPVSPSEVPTFSPTSNLC